MAGIVARGPRVCKGGLDFQFSIFDFVMFDSLIDAMKGLALGAAAVGALWLLFWVAVGLYDSAARDVPHVDEDYWLARGYEPLDASSTGMKKEVCDE